MKCQSRDLYSCESTFQWTEMSNTKMTALFKNPTNSFIFPPPPNNSVPLIFLRQHLRIYESSLPPLTPSLQRIPQLRRVQIRTHTLNPPFIIKPHNPAILIVILFTYTKEEKKNQHSSAQVQIYKNPPLFSMPPTPRNSTTAFPPIPLPLASTTIPKTLNFIGSDIKSPMPFQASVMYSCFECHSFAKRCEEPVTVKWTSSTMWAKNVVLSPVVR
jgi:hypothetical protein